MDLILKAAVLIGLSLSIYTFILGKKQNLSIYSLLRSIHEGIMVVDDLGRVIKKNEAIDGFIVDIIGERREILGRRIEGLLSSWPAWLSACRDMRADEFEIDSLAWGKKRCYRVKVYPLHGTKSKKRGTVSILFDITESKCREEELLSTAELSKEQLKDLALELKTQKMQLESIVNSMSDMAVLTIADKEGNILHYSDAANSYFFKSTYEAKLGSTYRKGVFFHTDGRELEYSELTGTRVLRGEKVSNFHFVMKDSNEEKHFLSNGTPVYDNNGNLTYGVFFTLDITEQVLHKRLVPVTEQLAALNVLKDKLFTVVTHDIREPMAALVSMMELFEGEKECCCDYREILTSLGKQVRNTYAMVENLLDWFRNQKGNLVFSPCFLNLSRAACEAINVYRCNAEKKGIQIANKIDKDMTVFADKDMLEVVLRNLINNAIKFTGNGGTITLQANKSGTGVIVSVADTGVGVEPEKAKTLFHEEVKSSMEGTAGEKGTGLGLMICREFVERNGGELWLESIPGEGSTFYFSLPSCERSKDAWLDK